MTNKRLLIWPAAAVAAAFIFGASAAAVFAASPSVSVSGNATPFSTITVSGSGFAPNEPIALSLGLSSGHATADGTGSFSGASLTVPNVSSGTYVVIAVGQNSGTVAFGYIYVSAFFPTASPSGWYLSPGSTLTWSGSGFAPNETVTVSQGSTQIASFSANGSGSFTGQGASTVPFSAHGSTITYTVKGSTSGASQNYTLAVANLYPYVNPSSWYILPGSTVTFSGSGFGASEGVSVYLGTPSGSPVAHITADGTGSFTNQGQVTIPYGSGTANYELVGDSSGSVAMAPITKALFYPSATPSAYYGAPGAMLTLSGSGFAPNEYVSIASGSASSTAHADGTGSFSGASFTLPTTPNTTASVTVTGQTSGAVAKVGIAVGQYYTWMNLSTWWAMGGSPLTITGHNFAAGETVNATAGSQSLGSGVANATGDVTIAAKVPLGKPGPATVTLTGQTSGAPATATLTISPVWTDFELGSYAGAPGAAINFVGHGYQFGEQVQITTDRTGTTPVATFTADNTGSWSGSWTTPASSTEGNLKITATAQSSGDVKSITYYVTGS